MHIWIVSIAYWSAWTCISSLIGFIALIEYFDMIKGELLTVDSPGWRGMVPSALLVGICLSGILSALLTVLATWF